MNKAPTSLVGYVMEMNDGQHVFFIKTFIHLMHKETHIFNKIYITIDA